MGMAIIAAATGVLFNLGLVAAYLEMRPRWAALDEADEADEA